MAHPHITAQMLLDWAEQRVADYPTYVEYSSTGEAARPNSVKRELLELTLRLDATFYRDDDQVELTDAILELLQVGCRGYNNYTASELAQRLVEDFFCSDVGYTDIDEFLDTYGPDA